MLRFVKEWYETKRIEIEDFGSVDCMVSADWSHGEMPMLSIGIDQTYDKEETPGMVDDTQIEISMPDLLQAFVNCLASGESNIDVNPEANIPRAYDCMISYLEYIKSIIAEKKAFYLALHAK